jgi:hypothetical protein
MKYQDFLNIPIEIIERDQKYLKYLKKSLNHYESECTIAHYEEDMHTHNEYMELVNATNENIQYFLNLSNNPNQEPTNENS